MAGFRLRKSAQADLEEIGAYTRDRWGDEQAVRYLTVMDACFSRIAESRTVGRVYRAAYLRLEYVSHVVFFRREADGTCVIVRVLHQRMLPELRFDPLKDDDE